jgi:hypothetical protein
MSLGSPRHHGLTVRSLTIGALLVGFVCFTAPYSIWIAGSSEITWSLFPISVGCPFTILILLNSLVKYRWPSVALHSSELIVILVMGLVVTGLPIFLVGQLLGLISAPYYRATPENNWENLIHPFLPSWLFPPDEGGAMQWFFEGLPPGKTIPYEVWLRPLFWWLTLIGALFFACFCIVTLLRRQWVEAERLVFPLNEMPRALLDDEGTLPAVMRTRLFWVGLAIPVLIVCWNTISYWKPGFPKINVHSGREISLGPHFPAPMIVLYFSVMSFAFFAETRVTFSIWFFYIVAVVQEGVINRIGYESTRADQFVWGMPSLSWQSWGAFVAMVGWSLYMARGHLKAVVLEVIGRRPSSADREMFSYRFAVIGLLTSILYMTGWLYRSGMAIPVILLFLPAVLLAYVGITRLVIQTGVYYLTPPVVAQAFALAVLGNTWPMQTLVAVAISYGWFGDVQSIFMPSAAFGARFQEQVGPRWTLPAAIGIALILGFVVVIWTVLTMGYQDGAANFRSWYFHFGGGIAGNAFDGGAIYNLNNPYGTDWRKLTLMGIGVLAYSSLYVLQNRFVWWPLHPVGLTTSCLWMLRPTAFSIFLGWLAKTVILKYGGVKLYRRVRPLYVGFTAGFFIGISIGMVVDFIWFNGFGHAILHG